jgi:hypothetical protein
MKELETTFIGKGQVKGFIFTQVKKSEKAYVYHVNTGSTEHYEVFRRKENKQFNCISYPGMHAFGIWAFTCHEHNYLDKFEELNNLK